MIQLSKGILIKIEIEIEKKLKKLIVNYNFRFLYATSPRILTAINSK